MLVIRIELFGAVSGRRKELGCAIIDNIGGDARTGRYRVRLYRTFSHYTSRKRPWREGRVSNFPRLSLGAFDLLLRGLLATVYKRNRTYVRKGDAEAALPGTSDYFYAPDPGRK